MSRNFNFYFPFLTLMMIVASCEVPIEIEGDSKIIVQSYFTDEQDLRVYVSESRPRASDNLTVYVENASVTLFSKEDLDFQLLSFVSTANPPYYTTIGLTPEVGIEYMLNVDVPGFKPVTASNSIPVPVEITDIVYNNSVIPNGDVSDVEFNVIVTIEDPKQVENYYHILFSQPLYSLNKNEIGEIDTILLDNGSELFISSGSKLFEVEQYFGHPSFFLNDNYFNGNEIDIPFNGSYSYDPNLYERGEFTIELRTVSSAYYEHFLNLMAEPEDPLSGIGGVGSSNVTNGAGVFAGYSSNRGFKNPN